MTLQSKTKLYNHKVWLFINLWTILQWSTKLTFAGICDPLDHEMKLVSQTDIQNSHPKAQFENQANTTMSVRVRNHWQQVIYKFDLFHNKCVYLYI
jgi:predicted lipase